MDINITLKNINYHQTLTNFIPNFVQTVGDPESDNLFFRALGRMGEHVDRILIGALSNIPESCLEECLITLAPAFENQVLDAINNRLQEDSLTSAFKIGGFSIGKDSDDNKHLILENVYVDYSHLLKQKLIQNKLEPFMGQIWNDLNPITSQGFGQILSGLMRNIGKTAASWNGIISLFAHHPIDSLCVRILEIPELKAIVQERIEKGLEEAGVSLNIQEMAFLKDSGKENIHVTKPLDLIDLLHEKGLSQICQQELVDGIVRYLKENWK